MTENNNAPLATSNQSKPLSMQAPETRPQRWMKYGVNVVVMSLAAIVLAGMLTYLAQRGDRRIDTTTGGAQSLSPQTVKIVSDLKQKVTLVGLYPKLKTESGDQDFYQPVADLLHDYATKGSNVSAEMIDPDSEKDRFEKFVKDVTNAYAGDVRSYKALLDDLPAQNQILSKYASDELAKFRALPLDQVQDQDSASELYAVQLTLGTIPSQLKVLKETVDSALEQQIPDYKSSVEETKSVYGNITRLLEAFANVCTALKDDAKMPKAIRDYAPEAAQRSQDPHKTAQAELDRVAHLGEMKQLDEFREQLKSKSIIVEMPSGYKILPFEQVWTLPDKGIYAEGQGQSRYVFTGEQRISMAIASLKEPTKRMVVFVRPGGPPLTMTMGNGQAPFGALANLLRDSNFDVMEKDASGMYAMQSRMPLPEPTPEQMKTAIWVVFSSPNEGMSPEMAGQTGAMLAEHMKEGGSAFVIVPPGFDSMTNVLAPWGIDMNSNYMLVHKALPAPARQSDDLVEVAQRRDQRVFVLNQYGNGAIAKPLQGFDFLLPYAVPARRTGTIPPETTVTPLLPIPMTDTWGAAGAAEAPSTKKLEPTSQDILNTPGAPLYGAMASEKAGQGRVVVIGSLWPLTDQIVTLPDFAMLQKRNVNVARCPGNGEFFMDSIFWLGRMDSMLEISPHSLQMARIKEMSPALLNFWRVGVLTAGLPAAVVVAGLLVFFRRRD